VPRWIKRLAFCEEVGISRTKCDEHIAFGHIDARKEEGGRSAPIWVDVDSYHHYIASLPKAKGTPRPNKKRRPPPAKSNTSTAAA
jgi:hypothetical protein